jgi:hypothetical protein
MNMKTRCVIFAVVLIAGMFLVGCGPIPAGAEIKANPDGTSAQVEFAGIVDSIAADLWVVAGQALVISPVTILDPSILTGDMVKVHATVTLDGTVTADRIGLYTPKHPSLPDPAHPGDDVATEFVGVVETIAPDAWVVSGMTFIINLQTEIYGMIIVGDQVKIEALVGPDGTTTAYEIKLAEDKSTSPKEGSEVEFTGIVESIGPDSWTVGGQIFSITLQTKIIGTIIIGDLVRIEALIGTDGTTTAHMIRLAEEKSNSHKEGSEVEFTGIVESIGPDSWTVAGQIFVITLQTEIKGTILVGDLVKIEAMVGSDGIITAHVIKLVEETSSSSDDGSEVEFTGIVESIGPDSWTVAGQIFVITLQTEIKGTILVGDLVKIEALVGTDGTITAHVIKLAGEKSASSGHGSNVDFTGVVESIGPDSWTVDGKILAITLRTRIKGTIIVGDTVNVKANNNLDGTLTAREIEKTDSHGSSTHDSDSDDHSSNPGSGGSSDNSSDHGSNPGSGSSSEEDHD